MSVHLERRRFNSAPRTRGFWTAGSSFGGLAGAWRNRPRAFARTAWPFGGDARAHGWRGPERRDSPPRESEAGRATLHVRRGQPVRHV